MPTDRYTLQPVDMTDDEIKAMYKAQGYYTGGPTFNPLTNAYRKAAEEFRVNCGWRPIGCETEQEQADRLEDELERAEEIEAHDRAEFWAENNNISIIDWY